MINQHKPVKPKTNHTMVLQQRYCDTVIVLLSINDLTILKIQPVRSLPLFGNEIYAYIPVRVDVQYSVRDKSSFSVYIYNTRRN